MTTSLIVSALLLGALLRVWALNFGLPSWLHPDEFSFVFFPLNFWSGDLNPHFFTYPTLQYYLLSLAYLCYFGVQYVAGSGLSADQFVAFHYFWDRTELLSIARSLSALMGIATVGCTALVARAAYGPRAGVVAAFLMAVCPLHVRQSHLAGVDAALTLWFTGAAWASLRLLRKNSARDYLLAGLLVGLAGATKYPGAMAGTVVLGAHLLAGRGGGDLRLYGAGGAALATFFLCSPYVLLDFEAFRAYFEQQAAHLGGMGVGAAELGWWYHLHVTLADGVGWPLLILGTVAGFWLARQRGLETAVVLVGFLGLFLVVGSGHRLFMRYALPLAPLLIVLAAGLLVRIRGKALAVAVVLVALQPFWSSLQQVSLLAGTDTRVEARRWMEANIPAGTPIANFGGWAGDVGVRSFEQLWWEASLFERRFGRERLLQALDYLEGLAPGPPYFSYGIQRTNQESAAGSFPEIERLDTPFVVVHRHPLNASSIDSAFALELTLRGRRVFEAKVEGLWSGAVVFDPFDAFYVPVSGAGKLERPGPEIEIWQIPGAPVPEPNAHTVRELFSRAYTRGITETLQRRGLQEANDLLQRASRLDPENPEVYFITGYFAQRANSTTKAIENYGRYLELQPASVAAYNNLATLYEGMGETDRAEARLLDQLHLASWKRSALLALAGFYRRQGEFAKAAQFYTVLTTRFSAYAEDHERLGLTYEELAQPTAAESAYLRALKIDRRRARAHLLLARLFRSQGRIAEMIKVCQALIGSDSNHPEAHQHLAYGFRHMGQRKLAAHHARRAIALAPEDSNLAPLRHWLQAGGDR